MTKQPKKCPTCGHIFKENDTFCPHCDLFIPVDDKGIFDAEQPSSTSNKDNEEEIVVSHSETENTPNFKHRNMTVESYIETSKETKKTTEEPLSDVPTHEEVIPEKTELEEKKHYLKTENEKVELPSKDVAPAEKRQDTPPLKPKKKGIVIGFVIVLLLLVGGGVLYNNHQSKKETARLEKLVATTENTINGLYDNSEHVFLKKNLTSDDIQRAQKEVDQLKDQSSYAELQKQLDDVQEKHNLLTSLNDLFKEPIMEANILSDQAYVKNTDSISFKAINPEKNAFDVLFNKAYEKAEAQKEILLDLDKKIETVSVEGDVIKKPSQTDYDAVVTALSSVHDPDVVKETNELLARVKKVIDENKKIAAEKAAADKKAKEAGQAKLADEQKVQNNAPSQSQGTPVIGKWGNREDSYIDLSDPAWAWAPGIQQQVMNEVISRGYVVEGGYSLVPKYIENGEGYYNLYATTNSKLFPNNKPGEFPIYVVTINVKTGWFKGNGPN